MPKFREGESVGQLAKRVGYTYQVQRSVLGGVQLMGRRTSYPNAFKMYLQHPQAYGIQRYIRGTDITAGLIQPTVPNRIKIKGKEYTRGYVGGHTKREAESLAKGFRKDGHKAVIRKYHGGWQVFVKFDQRKLR